MSRGLANTSETNSHHDKNQTKTSLKRIIFFIFCWFGLLQASAQIGQSDLAKTNVGKVNIQPKWIGLGQLAKCYKQSACGTYPGCPVYTFTGKGDWNLPANWEGELMPPVQLPYCYMIVIKPLGDFPCILPTPQYLLPGSSFLVEPGKHIIIPGNVSQNK